MARLRSSTRASILIVLFVAIVAPARASADDNPSGPITWRTHLGDGASEVTGTHVHSTIRDGNQQVGLPLIVTSHQPICQQFAHDDLAIADVCHRAGSLCPIPVAGQVLTPVWIMQAPASPRPRPGDWVRTGHACIASAKAVPRVVVSQADFRRLPIPAPRIVTQPPDRVTLINIGTNFLTEMDPVVLPAVVLGQRVRVRATPARYAWAYGDGHELATASPGHRYPFMPTAHTYTTPGRFTITLDTTFTGEFSVAGGPWQPIQGTAITQSAPVQVTAEERRAVLIS